MTVKFNIGLERAKRIQSILDKWLNTYATSTEILTETDRQDMKDVLELKNNIDEKLNFILDDTYDELPVVTFQQCNCKNCTKHNAGLIAQHIKEV